MIRKMIAESCRKCGSNGPFVISFCPDTDGHVSQYMRVECPCGNHGSPGWFLKGCGMEDMDDEQLAVEAWNSNQREKHD